jgi:hypothetical protein
MKKCWIGCISIALTLLGLSQKANAGEQHCGTDANTALWSNASKPTGYRLELVMYFQSRTIEIPRECVGKLLQISEKVKLGAKGKLIIRSGTSADSSSEMDLAIASERLEQIKNFLRNDRLALRAMQLELYSNTQPASKNMEELGEAPRVVEIYSSPVN